MGGLMAGGAQGLAQGGNSDTQAAAQTWPGQPFGNRLLTGKVAVITGAARGIGAPVAEPRTCGNAAR